MTLAYLFFYSKSKWDKMLCNGESLARNGQMGRRFIFLKKDPRRYLPLLWGLIRKYMAMLSWVLTRQGKVREKQNFAKVRKMSGNFDECQGNLKNKAKVRDMSGNFEIMSGNFALGLF